jgi:twitching motility protein PilT
MQMGKKLGMRLMDDSIMELFEAGKIPLEEAVANIDNKTLLKRFLPSDLKKTIEEH